MSGNFFSFQQNELLELMFHFTHKHIEKWRKQKLHLLGYWKSVGGVRFWVIATLWWLWCMTSVNGIVVPVKNMFWLRFDVVAHPNDFFCQFHVIINVQKMMMRFDILMNVFDDAKKKRRKEKKFCVKKSNQHK